MNTRKFKMFCSNQFIGFIFINDSHPRFPGYTVGTIWPIQRTGNWNTNDLELVANQHLTELFHGNLTEEEIKDELVDRVGIRENCDNFYTEQYN